MEVQPLLVAQATPEASSIINKAFFMQNADKLMLQVIYAPIQVNQFAVMAGAKMNKV